MIRHFSVTAQLVGPYLPVEGIKIGNFDIKRAEQASAPAIPELPGVAPDSKSCLVSISHLVTLESPYIVTWEVSAASSKVAYEKAEPELAALVTCMSLPTPGYKYISKILRVEQIRIEDGDHDPESVPSEALHVISYDFQNFPSPVTSIAESILLLEDDETLAILQLFKQGLDSEVYGTGNAQLLFFKVLEQVSYYTLKRNNETSKNAPDYAPLLKEIQSVIESSSKAKAKAKKIKQYAQKLRALDFEQIGERIKRVAGTFEFTPEIINKVDKIVKYRAKVIAHAGGSETQEILDDPRDTREVARIFILAYLTAFHSIEVANLWEFGQVPEKDVWYRYTYARSDLGE